MQICQLRGLLEHELQPAAAYLPGSLGQDRAEASYKGKSQTGTKVSQSSKTFSGALGECHGTSPLQVSKGLLHEAMSQKIATAVSQQQKNQESETISDLVESDNNHDQKSKEQDKGNNPSDDSICSEKPGECSSGQRRTLADASSKQFSNTVVAKHSERSNSEEAELDKLVKETESHIGKIERPSTVSLNETFDLSDSMDSSDEDTTVFQASESKTDSLVALGALSSAELVAGENEGARKATGELLNQGDQDSLQQTENAGDASAAVDANFPVDTKGSESESGAKRLEGPKRTEAFKEILGALFSTSKTDTGESSTNSNPVLHGDFARSYEKVSNSKVSTSDAMVLSLERDAEIHARQVIADPNDGKNVDTEFSADSTPVDDKANSATTGNYSDDAVKLATTERKYEEEDCESLHDAVILGNTNTSESSKSAIAMVNLAGAKHFSTEKNYVDDTVIHQHRFEGAEGLNLERKDTSQGSESLFKIVNKAKAKRRSLFPSVTTIEASTISALPIAKFNTSFDSAISQGRFFSPITIKGLTVGDTSSSLLEETEGADETTTNDAETVFKVDGLKKDLPVDDKTQEKLYPGAQKADESINKDIRSIYKEVATYHGSLFGGSPVRQRADQKHSSGPGLSKNFDADIKAIIDRSRLAVATKSNESGTETVSSLLNSLMTPKSESDRTVSGASSSVTQLSQDIDTASKEIDAGSKAVARVRPAAAATKSSHAGNRDEDKEGLESAAVVENAKDEDKEVRVASDADKMAEDIAEITLSDTIVNLEDAIALRTRTSTPVKQRPAPEAYKDSENQKSPAKDASPSKGLHEMPSCLRNMPQIVPVVQKAKGKSPMMPMFEDQSFDDDSFNV